VTVIPLADGDSPFLIWGVYLGEGGKGAKSALSNQGGNAALTGDPVKIWKGAVPCKVDGDTLDVSLRTPLTSGTVSGVLYTLVTPASYTDDNTDVVEVPVPSPVYALGAIATALGTALTYVWIP
jgi:hypothetical protein